MVEPMGFHLSLPRKKARNLRQHIRIMADAMISRRLHGGYAVPASAMADAASDGGVTPQVMTVVGPVDPAAAALSGYGLASEHLFFDPSALLPVTSASPAAIRNAKLSLDIRGALIESPHDNLENVYLNNEKLSEEELLSFRAAGGSFLVDATVAALGRNPKALRRLAKSTGISIVMGTGFGVAQTHPAWLSAESQESIAAMMQRELEGGVIESDEEGRLRAGIIGAIGISATPHQEELKVLRAAASVAARTRAPLFVDPPFLGNGCSPRSWSSEARKNFFDEIIDVIYSSAQEAGGGEQSVRVVFLKCGYLCEDTTVLLHLCSRGVFLSFDGIGCGGVYLADVDVSFPGDERLAKSLARLIRAGGASQLLLCHGYKYRMLLRSGGGSGLEHLPLRFLERLRREVGPEGQAAIADMTRGNLVGVLTYYLQPPPPKIEVKVWHCDACKKQFPEEHEAFTKFRFQFCSPKCLTAGRKATNNWTEITES